MHVTFISLCQKRARLRAQALLDRYAVRTGPGTWMTPITEEALDELHKALRQGASRNTAVACYRNDGVRRMRLAWVVGRCDGFGAGGAMPVASTRKHRGREVAAWVRTASIMARVAGLAHDIGKASKHFQEKLRKATRPGGRIVKDKIRHEFVSLKVFQHLRACGFKWDTAWKAVRNDHLRHTLTLASAEDARDAGAQPEALQTLMEYTDFAVATHHGLFGGKREATDPSYIPGVSMHAERPDASGNDDSLLAPDGTLNAELCERLRQQTERLRKIGGDTHLKPIVAWGYGIVVRAALILADHEVSARRFLDPDVRESERYYKDSPLRANTRPVASGGSALNQPLEWHLDQVGRRAQDWVLRFAYPDLPGVGDSTRGRLRKRSRKEQFKWQDAASDHLVADRLAREAAGRHDPLLVFNVAGTGTGKTRMNLRAVDALTPDDQPMRVAAGFNLRTLTLQTHDAFRIQMGMRGEEVACVIGDNLTRDLHDLNTDENDEEVDGLDYEVHGSGGGEQPEWLRRLGAKDGSLDDLIGTPVLVSTMDYLVNAGEPGKQAHHGHALLRVASSDLILDEVDSYDPDAIVAVLRVVLVAAMFGRNIVASSATLATPLAVALFRAFAAGASIRRDMIGGGEAAARVCFIDHLIAPLSAEPTDAKAFEATWCGRQAQMAKRVADQPEARLGYIQAIQEAPVKGQSQKAVHKAAEDAVRQLHAQHRWVYDPQHPNTHVSFGVVRVAHVAECVDLARYLVGRSGMDGVDIHVCPYHAGDFRLRRAMKERRLDVLFRRTPTDSDPSGNQALRADEDIRKRVYRARDNGLDAAFVVIATPVEEVGRDHDFDWGVIEPSSVHSIVQMAGRVNRHRLAPVTQANLALLDFNYREARRLACDAATKSEAVFLRPGHEDEGQPYRGQGGKLAHTLQELLAPRTPIFPVDARLQFGGSAGQCHFARLDDKAVADGLVEPMAVLLLDKMRAQGWMCRYYYHKYPLRARTGKRRWRVIRVDGRFDLEEMHFEKNGTGEAGEKWGRSDTPFIQKDETDWWLSPGLDEVQRYADEHGLASEQALELEISGEDMEDSDAFVIYARLGGCRNPESRGG